MVVASDLWRRRRSVGGCWDVWVQLEGLSFDARLIPAPNQLLHLQALLFFFFDTCHSFHFVTDDQIQHEDSQTSEERGIGNSRFVFGFVGELALVAPTGVLLFECWRTRSNCPSCSDFPTTFNLFLLGEPLGFFVLSSMSSQTRWH